MQIWPFIVLGSGGREEHVVAKGKSLIGYLEYKFLCQCTQLFDPEACGEGAFDRHGRVATTSGALFCWLGVGKRVRNGRLMEVNNVLFSEKSAAGSAYFCTAHLWLCCLAICGAWIQTLCLCFQLWEELAPENIWETQMSMGDRSNERTCNWRYRRCYCAPVIALAIAPHSNAGSRVAAGVTSHPWR